MDIDARPAVVALLAVVAIALAAATLTTPIDVSEEGDGFADGDTDSPGFGEEGGDGMLFNSTGEEPGTLMPIELPCMEWLTTPSALLGLAAAALAVGAVVTWRTNVIIAMALLSALLLPSLIIYAVLTSCAQPGLIEGGLMGDTGDELLPGGDGGGDGGEEGDDTRTPPMQSVLLFILLGLSVIAVALTLLVSDDETEEQIETPAVDDANVAAVARAAGRAADRIDDSADVDNEIYRAWLEMTRHLDVENPESSTPAEFAAAAVDAGMARSDVEELTALFEEVRYGGEEPTPERTGRARDALRRIEETYTEE